MRVLLASWAWPTHYLPLVPLGWALRAAGHEVCVASQPRLTPVITGSGLVAVGTGPDLDHAEVHQRVLRGVRLATVPDAPPPGATMGRWAPAERDRVRRVFGVFAAYADAMLDDLYAFARSYRPDLIVYDPTTYAAALVGAALGVPAVRHVHGVDVTYQARELVPELLDPLARRIGLPVDEIDVLGAATVDPCPPSMQIPTPVRRLATRYIPYNGPAVLPDWLREPPSRRRICLTWGTSTTKVGGSDLFAPPQVIEAARGLDAELVVAVTSADAALLGDVPPGVRVVESLALHLLLPSCSAVVHQGGNGTILSAALSGLPQVVLPQLPDQAFHAAALAGTGASVTLRGGEVTGPALREALATALDSPDHRSAAQRLRAEMLATPTPAELIPQLEALT